MPITLKPIFPKAFNKNAIKVLRQPIEEIIDEAEKEYGKTFKTFDHKPKFEKEIKVSDSAVEGSYLTSGEGSRENPYPFVARGTKVRYATMSKDFVSKTQPGVIGSGQGKGGVLFVNKNRPRPGIEDRRWEQDIAKKLGPRLNKKAAKALNEFVRQSGHKL